MATLISEPPVKRAQSAEVLADTQQKSDEFNWVFFVTIALFHLLALAAIVQSAFHWRWSSVVVFLAVWLVGQNVGIGMSYHRQLTHRGYATPKWLEYFMAACGTMALQGGPLYWVAVHRMHHQYTDKPGDPHSPRDGAWWSHMGWILNGSLHSESKVLSRYAPDLAKDPVHQWLSKYHWVPVTTVGFACSSAERPLADGPAASPGCSGESSSASPSACTSPGSSTRRPTCGDRSASRATTTPPTTGSIALITGGEGWHNNHHAHPVSARHGMAWYEVDFNYMGIQLLQVLGLAKNVHALDAKTAMAKSQLR